MTGPVGPRGALVFAVAVLAILVYAAYEINTSFSTRARLFGSVLIVPALALAVIQVVREARRVTPVAIPADARFTRQALLWGVAFFAMLWAVGLAVTVPLFALVYLVVAAKEAWPKAALYGLAAWLFIELLFVRLLHVPLPAGVIPLPVITN